MLESLPKLVPSHLHGATCDMVPKLWELEIRILERKIDHKICMAIWNSRDYTLSLKMEPKTPHIKQINKGKGKCYILPGNCLLKCEALLEQISHQGFDTKTSTDSSMLNNCQRRTSAQRPRRSHLQITFDE